MNSLVNALKFVGILLFLLVGFAAVIAVGMWSIFFLTRVGETDGSQAVLNLVFGVLLFMASLGIGFFLFVWVERLA